MFRFITGSFALLYLNHGTVVTHLLPMLLERGVALDVAVLTIALLGPAQVAGRVVMLVLERWLSMSLVTIIAAAFMTAAAACLSLVTYHPPLLFAFAVLQGAGVGVASIARPLVTSNLLGRTAYGAIAGVIAVPVLLAMSIAPSTGAVLWSFGGYALVFGLNLWFALLAAVLLTEAVGFGRRR